MYYLLGYSVPEDKCEAMWNDDYLGRIQNTKQTPSHHNYILYFGVLWYMSAKTQPSSGMASVTYLYVCNRMYHS